MRKALYILILFVFLSPASAQKLVIGSEIASFKSLKGEISWISEYPTGDSMLIDFYQPSNPTCVKNLDRLLTIADSKRGILSVVIMTREPDDRLLAVTDRICVGVDTTGNGFFERCHVQYLPYTMLVDGKNQLLWHGILNTLSDEMLDERLQQNGR